MKVNCTLHISQHSKRVRVLDLEFFIGEFGRVGAGGERARFLCVLRGSFFVFVSTFSASSTLSLSSLTPRNDFREDTQAHDMRA